MLLQSDLCNLHCCYISNVLRMLGEDRRFFLWTTLAGLVLRLLFFVYFPAITDDSRVYMDLANNWLRHGVYGQTQAGKIVPMDTRLPGYPAFLALVFRVFGSGDIRAALILQILLDLVTCFMIADLARRAVSNRPVARVAFVLAAMCPFLANYAAAALTETLEIFFTVLALDCALAALDHVNDARDSGGGNPDGRARSGSPMWMWAAVGASIGACILLRPDGGILLASVAFYLAILMWTRHADKRRTASGSAPGIKFGRLALAGIMVASFALAPLVPWTIRNFRTLHHFQPLAPRYANEPEELTPVGFNRWVKTWIVDYASVEEIYWSVQGDKIDAQKLPARALDEPPGREATLAVIADYNQSPEQELTPQLDRSFGELAAERVRAHPVRCHVVLPALRVVDMWLRPRTELLPPDVRWWEFNDDPKESALAVGFGLLNLAYVGAALLAVIRRRSRIRYLGVLAGFVLLRTAFLWTIENPEPRYTLECYPVVIVLAAAFLAEKIKHGGQTDSVA